MSTFEFVSVLMSIVVGLGITRILSSASSLIELRASIRFDFLSLVWAVNVLQYLVIYWWVVVGNWMDHTTTTFSLSSFTVLFFYGVFLYFSAALILPSRAKPGLDLRVRFESIRRPFFMMWLLIIGAEVADSFLKGSEYVFSELGPGWFAVNGLAAVGAVVAIFVGSRKFHKGFAVATTIVHATWVLSMFRSI